VVDDDVGTHLPCPVLGILSAGRRDHPYPRQRLASCTITDPTTPGGAEDEKSPRDSLVSPNRSNRGFPRGDGGQPVGRPNTLKDNDFGLGPTIRSSTSLQLGVAALAGDVPGIPDLVSGENVVTAAPTASTVPAASYPKMTGVVDGARLARRLTVDRIDRHGSDAHQDVMRPHFGDRRSERPAVRRWR